MLSFAKSWFKGIDKIAGLEIKISNDLQKEYRLVIIKNHKGKIVIDAAQTFSSLDVCIKSFKSDIPLALCITGKGIVNRFISVEQDSALSSLNADGVLSQKYETANGYFLSLIRKEVLNATINELVACGLNVLSVSLGNFVAHHFLVTVDAVASKKIAYDSNILILDEHNGLMDSVSNNDQTTESFIKIAGENIQGVFVNAYAVAGSCLFYEEGHIEYPRLFEADIILNQRLKFDNAVLLKRKGLVALLGVLIVLIINFSIYSSLHKQNVFNESKLAVYQNKLKKLDSLEKYVAEKKLLLNEGGLSDDFSVSQFCDALAATVPADIQLKELAINPVAAAASRKEKEIIFDKKNVIIKGVAKNMSSLNQWLKIMEVQTGITNLKMEEYHYDQSLAAGYFVLQGEF